MSAKTQSFKRTRLAPTPSGFLHLGNLYSFLCTSQLAATHGAAVFLRIDDMDQERVREEYITDIFETLNFFEIKFDTGPSNIRQLHETFSQRHRLPLYENALNNLAANGLVFACDCSREQVLRNSPSGAYPGTCLHKNIPLDTPGVSWRLRTANAAPVTIHTFAGKVLVPLPPTQHYFIVKRRNGLPAYQLCSLVDDVHFDVDLIVRGKDLLDSTIAQLALASCLGERSFLHTVFHHHTLITTDQGEKLSKSAGHHSLRFLRQQGMDRQQILAMLPAFP